MPPVARGDDSPYEVSAEAAIDRFYADVGLRVRRARLESGLTQDDLARSLLLARSSVANLEAGRQRVPAHTLLLAAHALHVALGDLLPEFEMDLALTDTLGLEPGTPDEHVQLVRRLVMSSEPGGPA